MSGTMRQLVNNMVIGVSKGFEKKLSLVGVGYKAAGPGFQAEPDGRLFASGQQRHARRHHGATPTPTEIRDQGRRPPARWPGGCRDSCHSSPEPYKGKGIRYADERSRSKRPRRNKELQHVDQERAASSSGPSDPHPHRHSKALRG
jgi:large subunit ribosomal protein L6